jgi:hypothetical protein
MTGKLKRTTRQRMSRIGALALAGAAIQLSPSTAHAIHPAHPFGVGLEAGNPFGVTGKYWMDRDEAVQFGVGWRGHGPYFGHYATRSFVATCDWVHHFPRFGPRNGKVWFRVHAGAGGGLGAVAAGCYRDFLGDLHCESTTTPALFARAPVGFNVYLRKVRFEFFAQLAPALGVLPEPVFLIMSSMGARYYF